MSRSFVARATLFALSALVSVSDARGDTQSRARVTIRGTGSSVVIERSEGPARKRLSGATAVDVAVPAGPLAEAVRQKSQGASDAAVISYLRAHAAELPPVVGSDDVKQLRKAGAGKGVVAYLATVAAVDIGETGEGYETAVSGSPVSPADMEAAPYGLSDAYALSGGYGASYSARLVPRRLPHVRRMALPHGRPPSHRSIPMRAPFSRHPAME
jgi:hypothetical protein